MAPLIAVYLCKVSRSFWTNCCRKKSELESNNSAQLTERVHRWRVNRRQDITGCRNLYEEESLRHNRYQSESALGGLTRSPMLFSDR